MDNQKDQIIDRLKQATNVLVTVSANPSVDQLAGAIGITLLLNKMGKHATAVFSGQTPSTIEFLQPEKTLEPNTDSLRDFIIALDKSKADKLRYKVEDQMVKIFITPYRTSISDKDLEFSQGDFNVEVVLAIGVNEQQDLDQAITGHGRILHDATVIGVSTQPGSAIGSINWVLPEASSLSEMLLNIGLGLKADVLDGQMATAFLTGIVAETDRFSNEKTSSETMQLSAKLMGAGANQQLVASQLETTPVEAAPAPVEDVELPEVDQSDQPATPATSAPVTPEVMKPADGSLQIDHGEGVPQTDAEPEVEEEEEEKIEQIHIDEEGKLEAFDPAAASSPRIILQPPTLGGTLTANSTPEGLDPSTDALGFVDSAQTPLLSHTPDAGPAFQPVPKPALEPLVLEAPVAPVAPIAHEPIQAGDSLADLEKEVQSPHVEETEPAPEVFAPTDPVQGVDVARDAVSAAVSGVAPQLLEPVQSLNAQPMDFNLGEEPQPEATASTFPDSNPTASYTASNPNFPSTLVPPDAGLPADNTAAPSVENPTAPPPVPPPMMPPAEERPADTAL